MSILLEDIMDGKKDIVHGKIKKGTWSQIKLNTNEIK